MSNRETLKDIYYEIRIGTAMLVFLIAINILILFLATLGLVYPLDSRSAGGYNGGSSKGETQNVQVP